MKSDTKILNFFAIHNFFVISVAYGPYWRHVKTYCKESATRDNLMFVKYEDLQKVSYKSF